jgi:hypothetical protein
MSLPDLHHPVTAHPRLILVSFPESPYSQMLGNSIQYRLPPMNRLDPRDQWMGAGDCAVGLLRRGRPRPHFQSTKGSLIQQFQNGPGSELRIWCSRIRRATRLPGSPLSVAQHFEVSPGGRESTTERRQTRPKTSVIKKSGYVQVM